MIPYDTHTTRPSTRRRTGRAATRTARASRRRRLASTRAIRSRPRPTRGRRTSSRYRARLRARARRPAPRVPAIGAGWSSQAQRGAASSLVVAPFDDIILATRRPGAREAAGLGARARRPAARGDETVTTRTVWCHAAVSSASSSSIVGSLPPPFGTDERWSEDDGRHVRAPRGLSSRGVACGDDGSATRPPRGVVVVGRANDHEDRGALVRTRARS